MNLKVINYFTFLLTLIQVALHKEVSSASLKISIIIDLKEKPMDGSIMINGQEFLWHVAVLQEEEEGFSFLCSGTIIHSRFVVTAANCVADVLPSELRVVAGLNELHHNMDIIDNPHSIYSVSEKLYPDQSQFIEAESLAVLKLQKDVNYISPQLTAIPSTSYLSKDCFVTGWGTLEQNKCSKQNIQSVVSSILQRPRQILQLESLMEIRNRLSLSSMFIMKLNTMFDTFYKPSTNHYLASKYKTSEENMCPADNQTYLKATKVTTSHHYKCLCPNDSHICLYSKHRVQLVNQIDIGSPIFCKIKKPKARKRCTEDHTIKYNFGLAGIITSKHIQQIPLLKHHFFISIMRASNFTNFSDFIIAVLQRKY